MTIRLLLAGLFAILSSLTALPVQAAPERQGEELELTARAAIVVEYPSGKILYEKNAHTRLPMASTTKIMTAILALQRAKLSDAVEIQPEALVGEASMGLTAGEKHTVEDILYGLMLPSGNDAAMSLAIHVGNSLSEPADEGPYGRFVALMNSQARAMGLADTHFANPHGLDEPGHYTTAAELASITWYALHDPVFNEIVRTESIDIPGHPMSNLNEMLSRYEGADGVKTGLTDEAGLCLVSSATRDGRRLIAVVLNAYRWYDDSTRLLNYGFAQDAGAAGETLNIARRAELLWLLAAGIPTALPTARPTAPPATPAAAGNVELAAAPTEAAAPAPSGGPGLSSGAIAATHLDAARAPVEGGPGWMLPLMALLAGAGALFAYWRRNMGRPKRATATASWEDKKERLIARGGGKTAGDRQVKPGASPVPLEPRRVSLMDEDGPEQHARRAIALAFRGQEGSCLAEFMMTLQRNPEFEFGDIDGFYDMPPAGYLGLARAYAEHDRARYAQALLQLGTETYPEDKGIRKMLGELQPREVEGEPVVMRK